MNCETLFIAVDLARFNQEEFNGLVNRLEFFRIDCVVLLDGLVSFGYDYMESLSLSRLRSLKAVVKRVITLPGIVEFIISRPSLRLKLPKKLEAGLHLVKESLKKDLVSIANLVGSFSFTLFEPELQLVFTSSLFWLQPDTLKCVKFDDPATGSITSTSECLDLNLYRYFPDEYIISNISMTKRKRRGINRVWFLPALDVNFDILYVGEDLVVNVPKARKLGTSRGEEGYSGCFVHLLKGSTKVYPEFHFVV